MKHFRTILTALVFLLLFPLLSWLLMNTPAEVFLEFRTGRAVDLKIYPSLPFDREIGKKAYPVELRPSKAGKKSVCSVKIPLKCLRKIYLEVPPGTDVELFGGGFRVLGFLECLPEKDSLLPSEGSDGLVLTRILDPEKELPTRVNLHTSTAGGGCEIRLTNDFPRFLAVLTALLVSAAFSLLFFLGCGLQNRSKLMPVLLTGMFMILLFGASLTEYLRPEASGNSDGKPRLTVMTLSDYPAEFSGWYRRHLPFRDTIYSIYYRFCRNIGISPVREVIAGQEDWLFLRFRKGETPYEDYLGVNLFSQQELQKILAKLIHIRDSLKKRDIRFSVFIAPAKMQVYGHKLPKAWQRRNHGITRGRQLVDYIRKNSDIQVEYPLDEILEYEKKIPVPLYYKHDTHWNFLGGYIGARSMMRLIDPEAANRMPEVSSLKYQAVGSHRGDLARVADAPESVREPEWQFRHPAFHYDFIAGDDGCYGFPGKFPAGKRVFFIRDSFSAQMAPFLLEYLSHCTFYWNFSLNLTMISEDHPDVVVLEMVDRFLPSLLSFPDVTARMWMRRRML